jgi:hypothetical protein
MATWTLEDETGKGRGYLRIVRDGVRVVDAFPFAKDADERWVREQAARIVRAMNEHERTLPEGNAALRSLMDGLAEIERTSPADMGIAGSPGTQQ